MLSREDIVCYELYGGSCAHPACYMAATATVEGRRHAPGVHTKRTAWRRGAPCRYCKGKTRKPPTSVPEPRVLRFTYTTWFFTPTRLIIEPTEAGVEEAKRLLEEKQAGFIACLIEEALCNGWSMIPPEDVCALTDGEILSEDFDLEDSGKYKPGVPDPAVYGHEKYMVENPLETWAAGESVYLDKH